MLKEFIKEIRIRRKSATTLQFKDRSQNIIKGSIATFEKINVNGINHTLLIRGISIKNPILLFLHGGPGCSEMGLTRNFNSELEKHYVVVNYDQRGACKSYSKDLKKETMNMNQFLDDLVKIINYLQKRFKKKKVYLMGHSFGSMLGTLAVKNYPQLFHAYIGVAQATNMRLSEKIAMKFLLTKAIGSKNKAVIKLFKKIQPIREDNPKAYLKKLQIMKKFMKLFGGSLYKQKDFAKLSRVLISSREYTIKEILRYDKCNEFCLECLWPEMLEINFIRDVKEVKMPFYIIQGRHDYQTTYSLAKIFYQQLKAPKKKFFTFENSAHNPHYEEPERFNQIVISLKK
ncbi:alpha/beta hydrolase [Candidatus Woesearchaeota archaeon]|nr:alpha/beta hydrolase [Candidatus Woesearchaeota archaeon]